MLGIIAFIFVIGIIILIHELGHFIFARSAGVLCHEFSFGMGPVIWQKKKGETMYSIRAIPIGGYVMMAGEDVETSLIRRDQRVKLLINNNIVEKIIVDLNLEKYADLEVVKVIDFDLYGESGNLFIKVMGDEENHYEVKRDGFYVLRKQELQFSPFERSMESKSRWQRFKAIFGGPAMNFLLALLAFFIVGLFQGAPSIDESIIGEVSDGGAYEAGIRAGDEITFINGVPIDDWNDIGIELDKTIGDTEINVSWLRDGIEYDEVVKPDIIFYSAGFRADRESEELVFAGISNQTLAGKAGLETGDLLVSIDDIEVTSWGEVVEIYQSNINAEENKLTVLRGSDEIDIYLTPYSKEIIDTQGVSMVDGVIGITADYHFSLAEAFRMSVVGTYSSVESIFDTIGLLVGSSQVGLRDIAGPVGIYSMTSRIASTGFLSLISWVGLLSVNIGVINLLPIPALDGGRLIFLGVEVITGKKVNRKLENMLHSVVYIALLGLLLFVTWNDILRLFGV